MAVELLPNSMSFRFVPTITVESEDQIPDGFTGRVRLAPDSVLESISWLSDGILDDPSPRVPAYTRYRPTGEAKQVRHHRMGRQHDPARGVPAVQGFYAGGARRYQEHYRYGRRHDYRGTAAIMKWRRDGAARAEWHYYEGLRVEPVDTSTAPATTI